jgi:O-glycosyl hydrolase
MTVRFYTAVAVATVCALFAGCATSATSASSGENKSAKKTEMSKTVFAADGTLPVPKEYEKMPSVSKYSVYSFDPSTTFQTMDGFGAAYTWYSDLIYQNGKTGKEALDSLFGDAKLSILRFKNEYGYQTRGSATNGETMLKYYKGAVERCAQYGEKPIVLMCCWSPAAYLKSNNGISGQKGATLKKNDDGKYCYDEYGQWWADAIKYYEKLGIHVDYVSIQNEVEFVASYDGCRFDPYETNEAASYAKAFIAVYRAFKKEFGAAAPKMIGPETMSCVWGTIAPYVKAIKAEDPEALAGIAHHLYVGGVADEKAHTVDPSSFITNFMTMSANYQNVKKWQTEYYIGHAIQQAELINNCLTFENVNAYLFWSGVWTTSNSTFENADLTSAMWGGVWARRAKYYVMRHFSEYIRPGYTRIKAVSGSGKVKSSAFISPDGNKVTIVLVNTSADDMGFTFAGNEYAVENMHVYQSVFGDVAEDENTCWIDRGELGADGKVGLPPKSVTTITLTGHHEVASAAVNDE